MVNGESISLVGHDRKHGQGDEQGLYSRYGKRVFDIGLLLFLLPVLVPVLGGLWLLLTIRGGQAIYVQDRVGRGGQTFRCYKFRSMIPDAERVLRELCAKDPIIAAEWQEFQKLSRDPRITPLGRVLRTTSLDELPQVINVLKGDMSLVGPRPFLAEQEPCYRMAGGHAYFDLRPGITGEWQVKGRNQTSFGARAGFDNDYGQRVGFLRDLSLIVRTAGAVLGCTGR